MTTGRIAAAAPSGAAIARKAMVLPSGDQIGGPAPPGSSVSCLVRPLAADINQICGGDIGSGRLRKASVEPFGAHRADVSSPPVVSRYGLPPRRPNVTRCDR